MTRLLIVTLICLPAMAVCAQEPAAKPAAEKPAAAKPATVPFELLKSQHMAVQVKVNGKGPFRLIFDTGAPVTLISNKVAKAGKVFPEKFRASPFAFFGSQGQFKIKELEMGELKVANVDAMVMDHPTVGALASALGPIDGIVGFNVFAKHRTTIDYQAKAMTFVPVDFQPVDMMSKMMKIMLASRADKEKSRILSPAGLLGLRVDKKADDDGDGVTVAEVFAGSAAAAGGLKAGDRLLTLDGRWTDSVADCYFAASRLRPGASVRAEIVRDGKKMDVRIVVKQGV
ncbi:MAG: retroviral-like aspartic protease family protein [Gemmataceae bacterium]|nr:retroviral-like aspartic protease family protein [Gemmataceae bacterium]